MATIVPLISLAVVCSQMTNIGNLCDKPSGTLRANEYTSDVIVIKGGGVKCIFHHVGRSLPDGKSEWGRWWSIHTDIMSIHSLREKVQVAMVEKQDCGVLHSKAVPHINEEAKRFVRNRGISTAQGWTPSLRLVPRLWMKWWWKISTNKTTQKVTYLSQTLKFRVNPLRKLLFLRFPRILL